MTERSYAQNGEDLIALNIFARLWITNPTYLDLGAYHPFDGSNTALLYERGWRGINVEAVYDHIASFMQHRPEDTTLCVAVGPSSFSGQQEFYTRHYSLLQFEKNEPSVLVNVMTVNEIIAKYWHKGFPDFLLTDLEGMDLAVLKSIDYQKDHPAVICAEVGTDASGKYVDVGNELQKFLRPWYFPLIRAGNNLFLVGNKYRERMF